MATVVAGQVDALGEACEAEDHTALARIDARPVVDQDPVLGRRGLTEHARKKRWRQSFRNPIELAP